MTSILLLPSQSERDTVYICRLRGWILDHMCSLADIKVPKYTLLLGWKRKEDVTSAFGL